jgi:Na+-translocating ferredoxin:NAD+ oxidoreductase RnfG subunit
MSLVFATGLFSQEEPPEDVNLGAEQYLMTPEAAIAEIFSDDFYILEDTLLLSKSEAKSLVHSLHRQIRDSVYVVHKVFTDQKFQGYALITEEFGKYRPITMLIGVDPNFKVQGVRILVYRENRGGEVQRKRFLHQYRGKDSGDPIQINRDIINISGATISVRGVNSGVKKVLAILEMFYSDSA